MQIFFLKYFISNYKNLINVETILKHKRYVRIENTASSDFDAFCKRLTKQHLYINN